MVCAAVIGSRSSLFVGLEVILNCNSPAGNCGFQKIFGFGIDKVPLTVPAAFVTN